MKIGAAEVEDDGEADMPMRLAFCRQITAMCRQYQQIICPILAVFWTYCSDMSTAWIYQGTNLNKGMMTKLDSYPGDVSIIGPFHRHVFAMCRLNRHILRRNYACGTASMEEIGYGG
jgi:hypothetical protein